MAVVSPAECARATWDLASAQLGERPEARHLQEVYAASGNELLDIIHRLGEEIDTVVIVGHNPGLEDLAETLIGDRVPLPTSALAVIEFQEPWRSVDRAPGRLRAPGRPPTSDSFASRTTRPAPPATGAPLAS